MKTNSNTFVTFVIMAFVIFSACKKNTNTVEEPPKPEDSPELLTGMVLQFTDSSNAGNTHVAEFRDPDGPGGKNPTRFDTIQLMAGKTYFAKLLLLDETKTPIDTISKLVWQKRNEHQLFFNFQNATVNVAYADKDDNGLPVGLSSVWHCGNTSTGTSTITLKHQPNIKNGSIAGGETDIELVFQTHIK